MIEQRRAIRRRKQKRRRIVIAAVAAAALLAVLIFYWVTTPKIELNGSKHMVVTMKEGYDEPGATASFSFRDISSHVEIDSEVNDGKVGEYKVHYTVRYLEKTAEAERTVKVIDKEPPEITLNGGDGISIRPGEKYVEQGFTAVDDSDGDVTAGVTVKGFVDRYNKGDYEIDYTVTDSYGNEGKKTRIVTVKGEPVKEVKGVIYLTFDDGPSNNVTPKILKVLEKENVPATFFVIDYGQDKKKMKTIRRAIKDGCTIGVHGYSHEYSKIYSSVSAFMDNVKTLHDKLMTDFGYDATVMRFPGGSSNTVSKSYCKGIMTKLVKRIQKEGYMYNDWNVDSTDAEGNNVDTAVLVENVISECDKDGFNVVLMHDSDSKETTAKALSEIIKWGKSEGYKFKAITPDSPSVHHSVNN